MREIWGLVPAAGKATRLGTKRGPSKEILPLPPTPGSPPGAPARPACQNLLESYRLAGVARALVLLRQGKRRMDRDHPPLPRQGQPILRQFPPRPGRG